MKLQKFVSPPRIALGPMIWHGDCASSEFVMSPFNTLTFVAEWIDSWRSRDLDLILSHYAENVEYTSPITLKHMPESGGTLRGKEELRAYFEQALEIYNESPFELLHHTKGIRSIVLVYRSINELIVAEMMEADDDGKIMRVCAHFGGSD
ncbi:MAG: nuclear transport factor 2 family protein [Proteobacteria bacterium]|nr:MAG: nuclear transport factor 2 family protein [Pseudomonadota bacterium]